MGQSYFYLPFFMTFFSNSNFNSISQTDEWKIELAKQITQSTGDTLIIQVLRFVHKVHNDSKIPFYEGFINFEFERHT